jgi:hypothetical protein
MFVSSALRAAPCVVAVRQAGERFDRGFIADNPDIVADLQGGFAGAGAISIPCRGCASPPRCSAPTGASGPGSSRSGHSSRTSTSRLSTSVLTSIRSWHSSPSSRRILSSSPCSRPPSRYRPARGRTSGRAAKTRSPRLTREMFARLMRCGLTRRPFSRRSSGWRCGTGGFERRGLDLFSSCQRLLLRATCRRVRRGRSWINKTTPIMLNG